MKLEHITKTYNGKTVLKDLSLTLPDKGLVALMGPSGCGKTTLLRILAGLDQDYAGHIQGSPKVSMCFQEYRLFPQLNALKNAAVFSVPDQARSVLLNLGFAEKELTLRPSALSGGMKQRVSLARALCSPGDLLLLDEPLKELDASLRNTALSLIQGQGKERLVIMTVHDPEELPENGAWLKVTLPVCKE